MKNSLMVKVVNKDFKSRSKVFLRYNSYRTRITVLLSLTYGVHSVRV